VIDSATEFGRPERIAKRWRENIGTSGDQKCRSRFSLPCANTADRYSDLDPATQRIPWLHAVEPKPERLQYNFDTMLSALAARDRVAVARVGFEKCDDFPRDIDAGRSFDAFEAGR